MMGGGKGGRPQGLPKSGGRQKGTPNRSTQAVREVFEELDFNPIHELVVMAKDPKLRAELKVNILSVLDCRSCRLAPRCRSRLRSC